MTRTLVLPLVLLLLLLRLTLAAAEPRPTQPGLPTNDPLYREAAALDAAAFDAYNRCEPAKFRAFFTDDVEFYHDQAGPTRGVEALVTGLERNICGKVRRTLVPGSLQVFPMKDFGLVMMGVHRFHSATPPGSPAHGEARFIHLCQREPGTRALRITRVISYDHGPFPPARSK